MKRQSCGGVAMCRFIKSLFKQPTGENTVPKILHGEPQVFNSNDERLRQAAFAENADLAPAALTTNRWPFGYLFPDLAKADAELLPQTPKTTADLRELGQAKYMAEGNLSV